MYIWRIHSPSGRNSGGDACTRWIWGPPAWRSTSSQYRIDYEWFDWTTEHLILNVTVGVEDIDDSLFRLAECALDDAILASIRDGGEGEVKEGLGRLQIVNVESVRFPSKSNVLYRLKSHSVGGDNTLLRSTLRTMCLSSYVRRHSPVIAFHTLQEKSLLPVATTVPSWFMLQQDRAP